jgi:deoxyribonuclease-2
MSIDLATARQLATEMLTFQEPQSYSPHLPATLPKSDPLYTLTQPIDLKAAGTKTVINAKTRGGLPFKVIAKSRLWNQDFWSDLVGPTLGADMDDETWIRGPIPPVLDSDGVHKTVDLKYIDLRPLGAPWVWPETHDHAKWGITTGVDWVCVGDMNRMISQEKRGGGTIALQDKTLWSALSKTDFIKPPPGMTLAQAKATIRATHADPRVAATAERNTKKKG